jgi:hypothetical protein
MILDNTWAWTNGISKLVPGKKTKLEVELENGVA